MNIISESRRTYGKRCCIRKAGYHFQENFHDNKDMLHSFVADMLDVPQESISDIIITNPELPPETLAGKFSRLDLSLKVDNRLVNVEIQVKNDTDYRDRTLFYWAKLYSSELKSGEDYSELKQTITIYLYSQLQENLTASSIKSMTR